MSNYNEDNNKTGYPISGGMQAKPLHTVSSAPIFENPFGFGAIPNELGGAQQALLRAQASLSESIAEIKRINELNELLKIHNTQFLEIVKAFAVKTQG